MIRTNVQIYLRQNLARNEYPNIFVSKKLTQTNIGIYSYQKNDTNEYPNKYSDQNYSKIFVTLCLGIILCINIVISLLIVAYFVQFWLILCINIVILLSIVSYFDSFWLILKHFDPFWHMLTPIISDQVLEDIAIPPLQ